MGMCVGTKKGANLTDENPTMFKSGRSNLSLGKTKYEESFLDTFDDFKK